jgi:hypothetical protein
MKVAQKQATLIKVLIDYSQIIGIVSAINIDWPSVVIAEIIENKFILDCWDQFWLIKHSTIQQRCSFIGLCDCIM